jgi:GNAT superfamily N-acetyltransferase
MAEALGALRPRLALDAVSGDASGRLARRGGDVIVVGAGARDDSVPFSAWELLFEGENPAGIATWHWTYGSFAAARKVYLADLFVRPDFRGRQYGKALIANLAKRVLAHGGVGVDWDVLDWNKPAIEFYEKIGAKMLPDWRTCRMTESEISNLADLK